MLTPADRPAPSSNRRTPPRPSRHRRRRLRPATRESQVVERVGHPLELRIDARELRRSCPCATQTAPSPKARPVGVRSSSGIVAVVDRAPASMRVSVWSSRLPTQTESPPTTTGPGRIPTWISSTIVFVSGSITPTWFGRTSLRPRRSPASRAGRPRRRARRRRVLPSRTGLGVGVAAASAVAEGWARRRGRGFADACDAGRRVQRCVLDQDRVLQPLQGRARLDPELLDERVARLPVGAEGFGLPAAPVEGEHPLPVELLHAAGARRRAARARRSRGRGGRARARSRSGPSRRRGAAPPAARCRCSRTTRS